MKQLTLEKYFTSEKPRHIPVLSNPDNPEIPYVSTHTVARLVNNKSCHVLDARFPYEYEGGHIHNAINIDSSVNAMELDKAPIIVHCEHSIKRGPALWKSIRNLDRTENLKNYPDLSYPDLYVMDGGYKQFFKDFPDLCSPCGYVKMRKEDLKKVKRRR